MKIDWKRKLTSRKWWLAVAGLISGIIVIVSGNQNIANTVSGAVMTAASVVAYTLAEGFADAENAGKITVNTVNDTEKKASKVGTMLPVMKLNMGDENNE